MQEYGCICRNAKSLHIRIGIRKRRAQRFSIIAAMCKHRQAMDFSRGTHSSLRKFRGPTAISHGHRKWSPGQNGSPRPTYEAEVATIIAQAR